VAQAVIQLALVAGASKVYATVHNKHRDMIHQLGGIALPREPEDWLPEIQGQIDIVIDGVCSNGFSASRATLRCRDSKLVCIGTAAKYRDEQTYVAMLQVAQATWLMSQTTFFDFFKFNEEHPDIFKKDLLHLFQLLRNGWISPNVAKRISLKEVPNAHQVIEIGEVAGQIVCIPWLGVRNTNHQVNSPEKQMFRGWSESPSRKNKYRSEVRGWSESPSKRKPVTPVAWKVSEFVQENYKTRDDGILNENNEVKQKDDNSLRRQRQINSNQKRNEETLRGNDFEEKDKNPVLSNRRHRRLDTEIQVLPSRNEIPRRKWTEKNYIDNASIISSESASENETENSSLSDVKKTVFESGTLATSFSCESSYKNDGSLATKNTSENGACALVCNAGACFTK